MTKHIVVLYEPERFQDTVTINLEGVVWFRFKAKCEKEGVSLNVKLVDLITKYGEENE